MNLKKSKSVSITILGYWLDEPEVFFERRCMLGEYDGVSSDDDVFYWFVEKEKIIGDHGDFVVIDYFSN